MWAIISGIEGNLAAYEAVIADWKRSAVPVTDIYIIGDVVGPRPESEAVVSRLRSSRSREIAPQVCIG